MLKSDIIIAQASGKGVGAITIIRLSGKGCIELISGFFSKDLVDQPSHTIHFGRFRDQKEKLLDECLISIFKTPRSYTKEDSIEISCHGSLHITDRIINTCLEAGARMANPGEFTLRAFMNGQLDLSQAEAVAELIESDSPRSHKLALDKLRGEFSKKLKALRAEIINIASLIELELDFGEEDVEFADRQQLETTLITLKSEVDTLLKSYNTGNVVKTGIKTVIAGIPNAGKSTLLNVLIQDDRAIVSDIPGTTRDTLEEQIVISGLKFLFVDTAGLRQSSDDIEIIGVNKAKDKILSADLILYVVDISSSDPQTVAKEIKNLERNQSSIILILNKMDKNPYTKPETFHIPGFINQDNLVTCSARNNMNIEHLKNTIVAMVEKELIQDGTIITSRRHYDELLKTKVAVDEVLIGLEKGKSGDLLSIDLRKTLNHIGKITGEIHTDDLLENIFSNFCIGK